MFRRLYVPLTLLLALGGCRGVDLSPSAEPEPTGTVTVVEPDEETPPLLDGGTPIEEDDAQTPMPSVVLDAPADGAVFVQDTVVGGEWAANVTFEVTASGVSRVEIWADGEFLLGEIDDAGAFTYAFHGEGTRAIAAIGFDVTGAELARDEISITVQAPADTSCHAMLDGLGLDWSVAGSSPGIGDPVRVEPYINGLSFRYVSNSEPTAMLMDCSLAIALHHLTEVLIPYGIDEVIHIGIYNYRCIGGGDPDSGTCTPSQHAYATAIDLHAFGLAGSADTYSTETDWVINGDASCPIDSVNDKDRILKEIACSMWAERIFNIVLTPNYNSAHRNHFHVDLTDGSMYIGQSAAGIDPPGAHVGH